MRLRNMTLEMVPTNIRVVILKLRLGKRIEVGFDTRIGPRCSLKVMKGGKLRLRGTYLTRDIQLEVARNALLEIGKCQIGPGAIISAQELVSIGDGSAVAEYSSIRDQNHVHTPEYPLADWRFSTAPVRIGCDVWIASKVTVVAGITIADHAMCAARRGRDQGRWALGEGWRRAGASTEAVKAGRYPPRRRESGVTAAVEHGSKGCSRVDEPNTRFRARAWSVAVKS